MNFNETSRENVTYDDVKKTKKNDKARHSSDCTFFETYSKGYRVDFFLNGTPISIFAKLTIFHYI